MMCPKFRTLWRLRPRILTLIVLVLLAAPIVPANFSSDMTDKLVERGIGIRLVSYGWPLIWHRYVLLYTFGTAGIVEWQWNAMRLTGNVAMWLAMVAPPTLACEWSLRRYRPRLRWSLRTMLIAVGLLAILCAAITSARRRANLQDPIIAAINERHGRVWVDRWGPKWLELVGADRFCWNIIAAELGSWSLDEDLSPRMAERVVEMRKLRSLSVTLWGEEQRARGWLEAVGRLSHLEHLKMEGAMPSDGLECLAGLADLKSLALDIKPYDQPRPLGRYLPVLCHLEFLDLPGVQIDDRDIRHLSAFPRLKSLCLRDSVFTDPGDLSGLRFMPSLEELAIGTTSVSPLGIESLAALPKLNTLHIHSPVFLEGTHYVDMAIGDQQRVLVPPDQLVDYEAALKALRRLKRGITIDNAEMDSRWRGAFSPDSEVPALRPTWLPTADWYAPSSTAAFRASAAKAGILTSF